MVEDWLALPAPASAGTFGEFAGREKIVVAVPPPAISDEAALVAKQVSEAHLEYYRAWQKLSARQRMYLRALQNTGFSQGKALKILAEDNAAEKVTRQNVSRWQRTNANFRVVLEALKADASSHVVSRDDLLLRAHRIAEQAEEGQPVFGVDRESDAFKIIGHEKKLDTALRANEQLMKATKVLGGEENKGSGGAGPALLIQVVQQDGGLVDVTSKGVTIDLPEPGGT